MKQIILLIFIIFSYVNAYEFKLTKKDIKKIENHEKKRFIVNRLQQYKKLKTKVKDYTLIKKLSHINSFVNRILPSLDIKTQGIGDHWSTPKEFLINGRGDCEDYVITKYFTFLELGIKKENLYLSVVKVKGQRDMHMVLLYVEDKNKPPLVMDNLSFRVISLTKRKKLIPQFAFNEIDSYKLTKEKFTQRVRINWGKDDKWNKLLKRVYVKNE